MGLKALTTGLLIAIAAASAAEAMPITAMPYIQDSSSRVLIDYACGPGLHITPDGDCVRWRDMPPPPPPPWARHRYYEGWDDPPPPPRWRHHHYRDDWGWGGPPPPPPPWDRRW